MNATLSTQKLALEPYDANRLANLCGECNQHINQIEQHLGVEILCRGNLFNLSGTQEMVSIGCRLLEDIYEDTVSREILTPSDIHLYLQGINDSLSSGAESTAGRLASYDDDFIDHEFVIQAKRKRIKPKGDNQYHYVKRILQHDINFGIGPAGTGKTYLAVACAVEALESEQVRRIILVRPAVEAGEKLGFLPGDLSEKVNPYLRPLYDALYEMLGFERVAKLIDRNIIEVAPLAYMRGRTLNDAFIILDESQNTTPEQMKMLLTRIGFGSKAVITGDTTQIDLGKGIKSGLKDAIEVLDGINNIGFTYFQAKDIVRHKLVQRIVEAYEHRDRHNND